jgi:hypothetical protein
VNRVVGCVCAALQNEHGRSWWTAVDATNLLDQHEHPSVGVRYLISLYFIVQTMLAVGYDGCCCIGATAYTHCDHSLRNAVALHTVTVVGPFSSLFTTCDDPCALSDDCVLVCDVAHALFPLGIGSYGDVLPVTNAERLFAVIVQLLGGLVLGVLMATVSQFVEQLNLQRRAFNAKMESVRLSLCCLCCCTTSSITVSVSAPSPSLLLSFSPSLLLSFSPSLLLSFSPSLLLSFSLNLASPSLPLSLAALHLFLARRRHILRATTMLVLTPCVSASCSSGAAVHEGQRPP